MKFYTIDSINKTVIFEFEYNADIVVAIKGCGYSARWNPELKQWIVPVDAYTKPRIIRVIKEHDFKPSVKLKKSDVSFSYKVSKKEMKLLKEMTDAKRFNWTPRDYQLESLAYSLDKVNLIIGDDVGLGKTFEAIIYAEVTESFPCLVIVPSSVKYNWAEKWSEIVGDKRTISVIESGKKVNNWDADVIIINYDIIGKKQGTGATVKFPELLEIDWKMIIFDEGHFLKSTKSQRAKAAAKIVKKGEPRIQLLTGTATMNKPVELWNLLKLIKRDKTIAVDWFQFVTRYCDGHRGKFGWVTSGATNTLELNQKLRDNCYIRREKKDKLKGLPELTKQVLRVPITNKKKYDYAVDNFIEYIRKSKGEEKAEKAMEAEHLVAIGELRKLTIEGKIKAIEQYLKDWKEVSNEKLVIFGIHKEGLTYLSEKFKSKCVDGRLSTKKKHETIKDFIINDDLFLFGNIQSMGTGVDGLQKVCSNMLFLELPWRPSDLEQAIGRLFRSGQELPITATFILSDDTIDMDMWEMLAEKEAVTEAVNKGIDVKKNKSGLKSVISKLLKRLKKK